MLQADRWTLSWRLGLGALGTLAVLGLTACGSSVKLDDKVPIESRTATPVDGSASGAAGGSGQSSVATVDLGAGKAGASTLGRVVYFDFDSFVVKDEFRGLIEGHAKTLAANKGKRMVIEGHTDERGGREYNLALGQKRSEAVVKSLALLGAAPTQLEAVSFGKERPVDEGHDEAAWAKNRRAELKDR